MWKVENFHEVECPWGGWGEGFKKIHGVGGAPGASTHKLTYGCTCFTKWHDDMLK